MASVIARALDVPASLAAGDVLPIAHHAGDEPELEILSAGGALYLVEPRGRKLWLVAVLETPEHARVKPGDRRKRGWYAPQNTQAVVDLAPLRKKLRLGALEVPRRLTRAEEAAIRALLDDEDAPIHAGVERGEVPVLDGPPLARAAAYLAGGHVDAAVSAMAEAWRDTRNVALADAIERAGRLMRGHDRPLLDRYDRAGNDAWGPALAAGGENAYPQLLLSLATGTHGGERIEALAERPDDPRIARRLAALLTDLPDHDAVYAFVHRSGDARAIDDVHARAHELQFVYDNYTPPPRPQPVREKPVDLTAIEAALAPLEAAAGAVESALVDAIGERWDDDGPRLVYADWLLERAHPRGEYIALACERKLSPAKARRLALLEDVPYLFGALDDIATAFRRPRDRGVDRELMISAGSSPGKLVGAARSPLVRLLRGVDVVGPLKPDRLEAFAALVRAAPRLSRIGGLEREVATSLELPGFAWRRDELVRR